MPRTRRRCLVALAVASVLVFAAPAQGAFLIKATRLIDGTNVFRPKLAQIAEGTRVTWTAKKGMHTVTAYKGFTKNVTLSQGESTSFRFRNTGVFKFRCRFHSVLSSGTCSGMCGKIVVG